MAKRTKKRTSLRNKLILLVDDEPDIRKTVKTILEKEVCKTITAINGDDCLKKLKTNKPDLILMDIMMPGTPVKDIIKKIKGIKIAYLTAVRTSEAEKENLLHNGIVGFIEKPFDLKEFVTKVKELLK